MEAVRHEAVLVTHHAMTRMQQRGIRPQALEVLFDWGRLAPAGGGRDILYLNRKARVLLRQRNAYAILASDGAVVTVGHRYRRIQRS
jgi:hypothetical protein